MDEPEVIGYGQDADGPYRLVRLSNGRERVQRPHVTVEGTIRRADGTEEQAEITNIEVREAGA